MLAFSSYGSLAYKKSNRARALELKVTLSTLRAVNGGGENTGKRPGQQTNISRNVSP